MSNLALMFDGGIKKGSPGGVPVFGYVVYELEKGEFLDYATTKVKELTYGYGVVINTPFEAGTNNTAEYSGLLAGLMHLDAQSYLDGCEKLGIYGDSELVIKQLNGGYAVRQPHLYKIYLKIKNLLNDRRVLRTYQHVRREFNQRADDLANQAWVKYEECPYFLQMDVINFNEI